MTADNTAGTSGTNPPADNGTSATTDQNQDINALQSELESAKNKLTELTQISQQALADLQNFKKRSEEEKAKFIIFANAVLITNLLPMLDNIDRAIAHIPEDSAAREWANGIIAILKQLEETLKKQGLEKIDTAGKTFDPNFHEAMMTQKGAKDQIIQETEKGYRIQDRVLRRAKVIVGNGEEVVAAGSEPPAATTARDSEVLDVQLSSLPRRAADAPAAGPTDNLS